MRRPVSGSGAFLVVVLQAGLVASLPLNGFAQTVDLRGLALPQWTIERELRLGSRDGPDDAFVFPVAPKVDSNGDIYVLDLGLPGLLAFDSLGRFTRQIGGPGDGPGEYRSPAAFGIRGDTVWIGDMRSGRLTLYHRDGTVITTIRLSGQEPGPPKQVPVDMLGPEMFLVITPPGPDLRDATVGAVTFPQSIVRTDRSGTLTDTVVTYDAQFPAIVTAPGGRGLFGYQPIQDGPIVSYDPRLDLITRIERRAPSAEADAIFRVTVRTSDGTVVHDRSFRYEPLHLPHQVRDSIVAEARRRATGRAGDMLPVIMRHLYLPTYQPPVKSFTMGEDGTFWIEREEFASGRSYLILDPTLKAIATLVLPHASDMILSPITGTHLWAHETDEFEVPSLVRYRIQRR